jgi:hypothetical protein
MNTRQSDSITDPLKASCLRQQFPHTVARAREPWPGVDGYPPKYQAGESGLFFDPATFGICMSATNRPTTRWARMRPSASSSIGDSRTTLRRASMSAPSFVSGGASSRTPAGCCGRPLRSGSTRQPTGANPVGPPTAGTRTRLRPRAPYSSLRDVRKIQPTGRCDAFVGQGPRAGSRSSRSRGLACHLNAEGPIPKMRDNGSPDHESGPP